MKGADFGKAIGIDRPANIKDKIRKWQVELDAEPESAPEAAPDAADPKPPPSPKPPSTPKAKPAGETQTPKPAQAPTRSVEATPEGPKSAKKQPPVHNELDDDIQVATAPKKRVVSDSHWRNKTSPPKNPSKKPSPKPLPTAWVRPAVRKAVEKAAAEKAEEEKEKSKPKPKCSSPPLTPNPLLIFSPKITPQAQRARAQRQRRLSRPASAGNDARPTSSGSGSGKNAKSGDEATTSQASPSPEKEKTEMIRVRRRPRARTSPRGSLSTGDVTPTKIRSFHRSDTALSEDPANVVTVEYEPSESEAAVRDAIRERRRKSKRKTHSDISAESSPDVRATDDRHKPPHQRSYQKDNRDNMPRPAEPITPATPPQKLGSRLEMWLQTTPDPFDDKDPRHRRKSKDSISTLELPPVGDKTNLSASTDVKEPEHENERPRTSDGRRRRKKRSSTAPLEMPEEEERSLVPSVEPTESPSIEKTEERSPTPNLKRRGARRTQHSPTKERVMSLPARELPGDDEEATSTAASSSVDSQALDLDKVTLGAPYESPAMRRLFPSTGKRLSTIVSVDTFATKMQPAPPPEAAEIDCAETNIEDSNTVNEAAASEIGSQVRAETSTIISRKSTKRSRLASHADLISVLSMPKAGTRSIVSARSIRTNRSRLATATIGDIMNELTSDESKYMRELRTLVDGVIPVLLSCVLSKSDSAVAAGLFSKSSNTDPSNVTKPIVDMGVSLERLKTLHKRIPKHDSDAFLSWAQSAQRVYDDYIAAWRLGFQDVVISLASADEDPFKPAKIVNGPDDGAPWDEGMPRNAEGYVVNGDGERVDVAYMLKRPLVRLKYLAKSIKVSEH